MTFPVIFHIHGYPVPAHEVFEMSAYVVGVQAFLWANRGEKSAAAQDARFWMMVWCVVGAVIGSKVLGWLEISPDEMASVQNLGELLGGKTIVGGFLGGWIGVEIAKKYFGITGRTGDTYVVGIALGIAVGRIGCFLEGLPDHTYGIATSLPWGVDFGDGIRRHPTQIYEIVFALSWGTVVWLRSRWPYSKGDLFRLFMLGYFSFRLLVEFIKPVYRPGGLSAIQWACVLGIAMSAHGLFKRPQFGAAEVQHVAG